MEDDENLLDQSPFMDMDPNSAEFVEGIFGEMTEVYGQFIDFLSDVAAEKPDRMGLMVVGIIVPLFTLSNDAYVISQKREGTFYTCGFDELKAIIDELSDYGDGFEKKGERDPVKLAKIINRYKDYLSSLYDVLTAEGWDLEAPFDN
ncbi:hypothetical protein [Butyrivibrio sp. AE2032]|uniref:hypothetical protein n=1 Tax=Butyrivibrio sp. AE2032 TaxID=1458463 RepID=UPI00054D880E|nr:hypothetical protein [Butyrivibrio sp. AE2032]